ncbi:5465_t:CDS:10, partial [Dentiscutata heterogama]
PIVDYVRWQDVSETSIEATELFSKMHHEIILNILKELDLTDILAFCMVNRRCRLHTQDPYFWHYILKRDWKDWIGFEKVLKRYNIDPELTEKFKSIDDDTLNLKRAYMTLATFKYPMSERRDESTDGAGSWWDNEEFKLIPSKESEFGSVIKQRTKLFQLQVCIKYPSRGWYDVVWRLKIDKLSGEPEFGFYTTVDTMDFKDQRTSTQVYKYIAQKSDFTRVIGKGWFCFILPYPILIEPYKSVRNPKDMSLRKTTNCLLELTTFNKNARWGHSSDNGFTIDYVALRPHVHYDIPRGNRNSSGSTSSSRSSGSAKRLSRRTTDRGNGGSDEYIDKAYRTPKLPPKYEKGKVTVQNGRIEKKKNGKPRFYSKKPLQDEKRRIIAKQSLAAISNDKLFMDGLDITQRPITAPVVVPEKLKNWASTIIQNNGQRLSSSNLNHARSLDRDALRINFDKSVDNKTEKGKNAVITNGKRSWDAEFVASPNGHSQYSSDDISTPTSSQNWHSYDDIPNVSTPIIDESRQSDYMIENHRRVLESSSKYPRLTIAQQIQIAKYLDSHGEYAPSYMIIEKFNLQISAAHIRTLTNGAWLNDEVINFYGNLIIERAQNNPDIYPPVHVVNTFFYTKLMQGGFGHKVVAGWFIPRPNKKKKAPPPNIFDKDYIFIPINTGAHWTLAVVNFRLCRFEYYDSLGSGFNPLFLQELKEFFIYLAKQTNNQHFNFATWETYEPR